MSCLQEVTALQCKLGAANASLQSTKQQLRSSQDAVSILTAELEKSRAEVLQLTKSAARPGAAFSVDPNPSKLSRQVCPSVIAADSRNHCSLWCDNSPELV